MVELIILDETVKIKNRSAQVTKALKELKSNFKIGLTGYAISNRCEDLWSQIDCVQEGILGSYWSFLDKYTIKKLMILRNKKEFKMIVGYKNLEDLQNRIASLYIRRLKKDVLKLPEKIYETREIILNKEETLKYSEMKEEMITSIKDLNEEEFLSKASIVLVQLLRLSQISDGFLTDPKWKEPIWFKESSKILEIDDLLDELIQEDNKCVVWSRFVPMVLKLYDRYKEKYNAVYLTGKVPMKERNIMIDKFQNDDVSKVLIGQIQTGGMGLNLQRANSEIFVDKAFLSPSSILQAEDRLHRINQKKSVVIIDLVGKGTVDEHWNRLLDRKKKLSNLIFQDEQDLKLEKRDILELLE